MFYAQAALRRLYGSLVLSPAQSEFAPWIRKKWQVCGRFALCRTRVIGFLPCSSHSYLMAPLNRTLIGLLIFALVLFASDPAIFAQQLMKPHFNVHRATLTDIELAPSRLIHRLMNSDKQFAWRYASW